MSLFGRNERDGRGASAGDAIAPPAGASVQAGRVRAPAGVEMANIGKSITIKGDLSGDEDLVVEGNVEGRIELPNNQLTIGANGRVKADVQGKTVVVVGHVSGNVSGSERVEIQATGVVDGDVKAPRLVIQEGAVLNGGVEMGGKKKPIAAAPAPKAAVGDAR